MADFARYRVLPGARADREGDWSDSDERRCRRRAASTPVASYLIVKEVFRRAAEALDTTDPTGAATLRRAV